MGLKLSSLRAVAPQVPALRGLLASLGASVSLVAAGALALLAISAVIALEGWPGLEDDAGGRTLSIGELSVPRSEPGEPQGDSPVVLADAPEDDEPPAAAEPEVPDDTALPVADVPAPLPESEPAPIPPATPAPAPAPTPDPPAPAPTPSPRADPEDEPLLPLGLDQPVRELTELTGELLRGTGQTLAPVPDAVLPGSGEAVEGLTDDLGDTVESTGVTVSSTLGLLLGDEPTSSELGALE